VFIYESLVVQVPLKDADLTSVVARSSHQLGGIASPVCIHEQAAVYLTVARPRQRRTSTLPITLTLARPPTRAWEVARTVVAPPSSVVKCLWEVFVWGFGVLFLSCACVMVWGVLFSVSVCVCVCVCVCVTC